MSTASKDPLLFLLTGSKLVFDFNTAWVLWLSIKRIFSSVEWTEVMSLGALVDSNGFSLTKSSSEESTGLVVIQLLEHSPSNRKAEMVEFCTSLFFTWKEMQLFEQLLLTMTLSICSLQVKLLLQLCSFGKLQLEWISASSFSVVSGIP